MQLFFLLFLFSGYFCLFDLCVVCIMHFGRCNQSSVFLCSLRVVVSMYQCWRVLFFLLYLKNIVCLCHLWDVKVLCIVMSFLVLWSISLSSSLVPIKNGPEYPTWWIAQVFIPSMRFLRYSSVSSRFFVLQRYSFFYFCFHL